ncbi:MAG: ribbon-helix-helix protein, CopG family [Rubrobacteraceae bacterium]
MEKVETKISRDLMEAVKARARKEERDSDEVIEDALRSYLKRSSGGIVEVLDRMAEGRRQRGIEELSEEEAMKLAVEEQHAWRRERRERIEREEGRRSKP